MTPPPDDLEQKVNSVLEKIQLTEENQQLKSKVVQLEKKLRPFQKPGEEKQKFLPEMVGKIFLSVVTAGILTGIGYIFYRANQADSYPRQSPYHQAVELHDKKIRKETIEELPEKYDKVEDELDLAILRNPKDADAYWRKGKLCLNFGEYQDALRDFSKAIELNPHNGDYLYSRATARCYLGDEDAAISDINTLAVLGSAGTPPQLDSTVQLGKCFFIQEKYGLAEELGYQRGEGEK